MMLTLRRRMAVFLTITTMTEMMTMRRRMTMGRRS
jgi:hypothetical protein